MNRLEQLFARNRAEKRSALAPFLTAGDPDLETTAALLEALPARGADLIELGIPYSDPVADGPVIAASYTRALGAKVTVEGILGMVRAWRAKDNTTPVVAMVSYAIVYRRGPEAFLDAAASAGFDGLIVPDLPVEESENLGALVRARGLTLTLLATPTTPRERALRIAQASSGFLYYVSVVGITGERRELPPELVENVGWLRQQTPLPIAIGFGISAPDQVRALAPVADAVIVGSALVRRVHEASEAGRPRAEVVSIAGDYVASLAEAVRAPKGA